MAFSCLSSSRTDLKEVFLVVLPELPHDDPAEVGVVDHPVDLDLVDQVLDLRLRRVQPQLLHRDGQVLEEDKKNEIFSAFIFKFRVPRFLEGKNGRTWKEWESVE